ncbi:exodeoxyribonuclease VII large subunit [Pontivivens insulae]|nr:exodeoxyribonuclease VII large subunit [Pontivivens insulae]
MSELFDDGPEPGDNAPALSISDLSRAVKRSIEDGFGHVRVRGEVGRVSRPRSGHIYLDLKDDKAVLNAVIWKGVAARLRTLPEEGMEVIATGKLTTFPGGSRYQLIIDDIAPAGVGALMAMLEKRREKLAAEGLFNADRKQPLPFLPEVIGVVTSPSGAVIRDILHRLRDRFPRKVLVWPVAVQGERCAPEVANAIRGFNALTPGGALPRPDLLIVARGGGSLEDLWGFNEEAVVRAAAESAIPLISAVGHETDTTLIDHAADRRAPTPTAAAEMAVPVRSELLGALAAFEDRRVQATTRLLRDRGERLRAASRLLPRPEVMVAERAQRLDAAVARLPGALERAAQRKRIALGRVAERLSPARLQGQVSARRATVQALQPERALRRHLDLLAERLDRLKPRADLLARQTVQPGRELNQLSHRLSHAAARLLPERSRQLSALGRTLETLSYRNTLARGYAVIRAEDGLVTRQDQLSPGQAVSIVLSDGDVGATINGGPAAKPKRPPRKSTPKPEQGSLF